MDASYFLHSGAEADALTAADNYRRRIASCFSPHLGEKASEAGAGIGIFTKNLLPNGKATKLVVPGAIDNPCPLGELPTGHIFLAVAREER